MLSNKPCLHVQLQKHNKSYWKVRTVIWNFPGGGGIWTAFRPGEGEIWTKIFQKWKCPGGCLGGMLKLQFDWYIRNVIMLQHFIIHCLLYYLSSGCLWEVENKGKFQTFSPVSGRNHLWGVVAYCWWALARQLPILYNSKMQAKSVGCKIEDMRSRLCFLYPGISGCLWMYVEISITF